MQQTHIFASNELSTMGISGSITLKGYSYHGIADNLRFELYFYPENRFKYVGRKYPEVAQNLHCFDYKRPCFDPLSKYVTDIFNMQRGLIPTSYFDRYTSLLFDIVCTADANNTEAIVPKAIATNRVYIELNCPFL